LGDRTLTLETGQLASQANASVLARYGDTIVLATVVAAKPKEDLGYFPLSVEYLERLYAGGRIKGSRWVKREGRPSDEAILAGRLIDRSIRPLFPKGYANEVQITITVLSVDSANDPEVLGAIATSAALAISDIPWNGPIGTVRIGSREKTPFLNPINGELELSDLNLIVSANKDKVVMLEARALEISEELLLEAINFGHREIGKIIGLIEDFAQEAGVKKRAVSPPATDQKITNEVKKLAGERLGELICQIATRKAGQAEFEEMRLEILSHFEEKEKKIVLAAIEKLTSEKVRSMILAGKRPDGRKTNEIRPLEIEAGVLPRTHGSAIFRRGETQVLTVTTLGAPSLEQLIESPLGEETKRYIHHYSMPPFSVGEVGRVSGPNRREIGHGALAEKALEPVIPKEEKFPYTIRVATEVLSSNGSTSMASACGSSLSLMDAGVPISSPVAGIALGLITGGEKESVILSDIAGLEDANGDMDFKVAGTKNGITAIQLDVKTSGLNLEIIEKILAQGKEGRLFILDKMAQVLPASRPKISQYAPKVAILHVAPDKIGEVIGPGGRTIRKIIEETGCAVEVEDDGTVNISGTDETSVASAIARVEGLTKEVGVDEVYEGTVRRIQPFGAFVEILPGKEGLVHVSQMSDGFVQKPEDIVSLGQKVKVRVREIDDQGRINLSMLFGETARQKESPRPSRPPLPFRPRRNPSPPFFRQPQRSRWGR